MTDKDTEKASKQPFVSQADRPEVRLKSDTPLTELRVRDLAYLLGQVGGTGKDFWDGKDWQKDDFDGPLVIKGWKEEKEFKDKEKEKDKDKEKEKEKEKLEKPEGKEQKVEKLEPCSKPAPCEARTRASIRWSRHCRASQCGSLSSPTRLRS